MYLCSNVRLYFHGSYTDAKISITWSYIIDDIKS